MPTNADLAARLMREAANFFRSIGEQNHGVQESMANNAQLFEQVADMVQNDPTAEVPEPDGQEAGEPPAGNA